ARDAFDKAMFTAYLDQVDAGGAVRPRHQWAPGKDMPAPVPERRFSAAWSDAAWIGSAMPALEMGRLEPGLAAILGRSLDGIAPTRDEIERLFVARGAEVDAIAQVA
ncbi:MAG: hypothetical protein GWO22_03130, partial [Actinobacteria bacterium]|nr:hypothetical protein [Actinomycetota bacterium]